MKPSIREEIPLPKAFGTISLVLIPIASGVTRMEREQKFMNFGGVVWRLRRVVDSGGKTCQVEAGL